MSPPRSRVERAVPAAGASRPRARLGPDLSIVSVGEATRLDAHSLRVPVVLGDREGQTSTLMLTIRLDALVDEDASG